jgi:hypothetical protein
MRQKKKRNSLFLSIGVFDNCCKRHQVFQLGVILRERARHRALKTLFEEVRRETPLLLWCSERFDYSSFEGVPFLVQVGLNACSFVLFSQNMAPRIGIHQSSSNCGRFRNGNQQQRCILADLLLIVHHNEFLKSHRRRFLESRGSPNLFHQAI